MSNKQTLDLTKPLRTRDGLGTVTIYCTDAPGDYPIHGRVQHPMNNPKKTFAENWDIEGHHYADSCFDLANLPEPLEVWVNIYEKNGSLVGGCGHQTRMIANANAGPNRIGCVLVLIDNHRRFDE